MSIVDVLLTERENRIREYEARVEELEDALWRIVDWSRAYPVGVFPKPNLEKAAELLRAGGMTLDAVSADAMRHVVQGVGRIASDALELP